MTKSSDKPNCMRFFEGSTELPEALPERIEAYRQKWIDRDKRAEELLNAMKLSNPLRIAGEHVYAHVQRHVDRRLGQMLLQAQEHRCERERDFER